MGTAVALVAAAPATAVSGGGFTTINSTVDGSGTTAGAGLCHNGNPNVNCNQYFNKRFVWMNGGPDGNSLTDGKYFFAVLVPGMQHNPNDQVPVSTSDKNLSDDFDTYKNRTFTVKNGEIDTYTGNPGETPHDFAPDPADNNEKKIRLMPYSNTSNNGGVYILAICSLEPDRKGNTYPVKPQDCKYDAFKILEDKTPPECPSPTFGVNASGQKTATQLFRDLGGIDRIDILKVTNATISPLSLGANFFQGTTSWVTLVATKIDQSKSSSVEILVTDVGGNSIRCDPVLTTLRVGARAARAGQRAQTKAQRFRVSRREDRVTVTNRRHGLSRVVVTVNGRRYVMRGLRSRERRVLDISAALRPGKRNVVTLRGVGAAGAKADITIAN